MIFILAWFSADARSRDFRPSIGLKVSMFLLPPVAAVYYRIRQTGWKNGLMFFGILLVVTVVGIVVTEMLWWIIDRLVK